MSSWIISMMVEHTKYVEPFCGAASVLLRKQPVHEEIINDLNGRLVSVFYVLRDTKKRKQLAEMLRFTPYSRAEYQNCQHRSVDPLEDARRMFVMGHQSYASIGVSSDRHSGWRRGLRKNGRNTAQEWLDIPDLIEVWGRRLSGVFIESMDALELIKQTDSVSTLFYVDPPYVMDTRSSHAQGNYNHEMTDIDHAKLAGVLNNIDGMALLSGYASDLYDRQLYPDWARFERPGTAEKTEVLWLSPRLAQRLEQNNNRQSDLFSVTNKVGVGNGQ